MLSTSGKRQSSEHHPPWRTLLLDDSKQCKPCFIWLFLLFLLPVNCWSASVMKVPPPLNHVHNNSAAFSSSKTTTVSGERHQKHVSQHKNGESWPNGQTSSFYTSIFPINVRNDGGEVFREVITTNILHDFIRLDFEETDGSQIRLVLDFKNVGFNFIFFIIKYLILF